jgi:hypothetical protein
MRNHSPELDAPVSYEIAGTQYAVYGANEIGYIEGPALGLGATELEAVADAIYWVGDDDLGNYRVVEIVRSTDLADCDYMEEVA